MTTNEEEGVGVQTKKRGVGVRGAETPYYYLKCVYTIIMLLKVEDALGTLVEQQVEDAEVG